MSFSCGPTCGIGVGCAGGGGHYLGATAGWDSMLAFRWVLMAVLLFLVTPGIGQAGGVPWGTGYYRVRPEISNDLAPSVRSSPSSKPVDRRAGAESSPQVARPWGEVPLGWSEGETDRDLFVQHPDDNGRVDQEMGYGGRWNGGGIPWRSSPYVPDDDGGVGWGSGLDIPGYGPGWGRGWQRWGGTVDPWMGGVDDRYLFHPGPYGW